MGAVHRKAGVSNPRSNYEPKRKDSEQYINSFKQILRNVESFSYIIGGSARALGTILEDNLSRDLRYQMSNIEYLYVNNN